MLAKGLIRTFGLSGLSSVLSFALYALYTVQVGLGSPSDSFFSALAVSQTLSAVLFAPFDSFLLRSVRDELHLKRDPVWGVLSAYVCLTAVALIAYYGLGEALVGPLFGQAYSREPALWRYNYRILGSLIPLSGLVAILQTYWQAREHYDLPKVAMIIGRVVALVVLVAYRANAHRVVGLALIASQVVALTICLASLRHLAGEIASSWSYVRVLLKEWFHVNRWTIVLRSDGLLDRILAANVRNGFLSLFNLAWSAMMSVLDAYQSSFVAADSNRYYQRRLERGDTHSLRDLLANYHASARAGLWLTTLTATALFACYWVARGTGLAATKLAGLPPQDLFLVLTTITLVQLAYTYWKQLAGLYAIHQRAVDFARYIGLIYLVFIPIRVGTTVAWASWGFCSGLVAYYAVQLAVLLYFLPDRRDRTALPAPNPP
jgi:hypothetical protein